MFLATLLGKTKILAALGSIGAALALAAPAANASTFRAPIHAPTHAPIVTTYQNNNCVPARLQKQHRHHHHHHRHLHRHPGSQHHRHGPVNGTHGHYQHQR